MSSTDTATLTEQLTFAEFGSRFIEHAISPELVALNLARIVPPQQTLTLASPIAVSIDARAIVGAVERLPEGDYDRELIFHAPLHIHLELQVDLMLTQEQYQARAEALLRLIARAHTPLTVRIDCEPASPSEIEVISEGLGNWFDLVKRFGGLDDAIKEQVALMINRQIAQSELQRSVDIRALIGIALEATGMQAPAKRPASKRTARASRAKEAGAKIE